MSSCSFLQRFLVLDDKNYKILTYEKNSVNNDADGHRVGDMGTKMESREQQ